MDNPLGIKRFGPITFYVHDAAAEAERLSKLLGMKIAYVPSGSDPIYGIEAGDVLFIFDSAPKHAALAAQYGNHVAEIGLKVVDSRAAVALASARTSQPTRFANQPVQDIYDRLMTGSFIFVLLKTARLRIKE